MRFGVIWPLFYAKICIKYEWNGMYNFAQNSEINGNQIIWGLDIMYIYNVSLTQYTITNIFLVVNS